MTPDRIMGQRAGIRWAIAMLRAYASSLSRSDTSAVLLAAALDLSEGANALRTEDASDIAAGLEALNTPIVATWPEVRERLDLGGQKDRIDYDHAGNLDDVVINNVDTFRLEYMDHKCIWLACYRPAERGGDVVFWLNAKGRITGRQGED